MVESAAWITERKNVLSLALYLGALLAYLRYAQGVTSVTPVQSSVSDTTAPSRHASRDHASLFYGLAFVLFLGALLAKTTAFSLPAVILLIGWWQRGQIRWRADVLPTLPFFALALGLCAVTAWLEKYHVGAQGSDFDLTFPQRCLIAGPGVLVLPRQTVLAGEALLRLPALATRPRFGVAMALSGDRHRRSFSRSGWPGGALGAGRQPHCSFMWGHCFRCWGS